MTIVALNLEAGGGSKGFRDGGATKDRYGDNTVSDVVRERWLWLLAFFFGLMIAAVVVSHRGLLWFSAPAAPPSAWFSAPARPSPTGCAARLGRRWRNSRAC
jgi:hypothetical protein